MPSRRFFTLVYLAFGCLAILFLFTSSLRDSVPSAGSTVKVSESLRAELPQFDDLDFKFTWHQSGHKPPEQENSTNGDTSWYSHWKWLNPFSSSVTLDEDRAVLPPPRTRIPVYTYYEVDPKQNRAALQAEKELLLTWKRAWWAHGFKPVILTKDEAENNPVFPLLREKSVHEDLLLEFRQWLAWGYMGDGILSSSRCLPMTELEDPFLSSLRQEKVGALTRFEGMGTGLLAGGKIQIQRTVQEALESPTLTSSKHISEVIKSSEFKLDHGSSFACYDLQTVASKYAVLGSLMKENPTEGTRQLAQLMNAHLHSTWQNSFSEGINILKPLPAHTSKLIEPGEHLAKLLTECPESILQSSCPPNRPRCSPCVGARMPIRLFESFRNKSSIFAIATIPHPYTMISLDSQKQDLNVTHIRLSERDRWIRAVTRSFLGDGRGGPSRVVALKEVIASEVLHNRGLWFTVEHFPANFIEPAVKEKVPANEPHPEEIKLAPFPEHWLEELDWQFGFSVPRNLISHGETHSPVPGLGIELKGVPADRKSSYDPPPPTYEEAQTEIQILETSRETINSKDKQLRKMRDIAEAWNLADAEIWKFARAYRARSIMERQQWEKEEAAFSGPTSARGKDWW